MTKWYCEIELETSVLTEGELVEEIFYHLTKNDTAYSIRVLSVLVDEEK